MSLNFPVESILGLYQRNPNSSSARALASALKVSITKIEDPLTSKGAQQIVKRFSNKLDLNILNQYKIILSKSESCELLRALGVHGLSNSYLNRYIDNTTYSKIFNKSVAKYSGRGNAKIVLTYAEIIYFYTEVMGRKIPDTLTFPESLVSLADEGDILFPESLVTLADEGDILFPESLVTLADQGDVLFPVPDNFEDND